MMTLKIIIQRGIFTFILKEEKIKYRIRKSAFTTIAP